LGLIRASFLSLVTTANKRQIPKEFEPPRKEGSGKSESFNSAQARWWPGGASADPWNKGAAVLAHEGLIVFQPTNQLVSRVMV